MTIKKKRKSIAIIRALDVRINQAEFASHFTRLKPVFVSNNHVEVENYLKSRGTKHIRLEMKSPYLIEPVRVLMKGTSHQSWLIFKTKALEEALEPIDIYQINEPFFLYSGQVAGLARKFNKPLVSAPWTCFDHISTHLPPYSFSVNGVMKATDLFVIRTKRVDRYLTRFKIPDSKKVLIYHGVNTKRFYPAKRKNNEKVRILFVGILHESKGLNDLLDIYPKLVKRAKREIELFICGKGELEKRIKKMAKTYPITHKGYVSHLDLPDVYRSADIFCGPSKEWISYGVKRWEESFGFVFVEAMASGLPVVTNKSGAIPEVVGNNNYVNKEGDKTTLLRSLLELVNDGNLRRDIGNKNRERVLKYFDLEKQIIKEERELLTRLY